MRFTCTDCGKDWGGYRTEHCPVCHETFGSTAAGDRHRKGDFPDGRYCDTSDLAWHPKRNLWVTSLRDGEQTWGTDEPEEAVA